MLDQREVTHAVSALFHRIFGLVGETTSSSGRVEAEGGNAYYNKYKKK